MVRLSSPRRSLLLSASLCVALAACGGPPRGSTGGRIDPYRTTAADRASRQASIPALLEFSDRTADQLARDLAELPDVRNAETRLVLELGTIDNQTRTSTNDFEMIQRRLRSNLAQSELVTNNFKIVESVQRMDREQQRVQGGDSQDLLQEQTRPGATARYAPEQTYLLQGDFYQSTRGDRRQYFFEFKLTHLASREIVFTSNYDLGQVSP